MKNDIILCVIFCFVIHFDRTSATYKRWLPDTNFENPNNWNLRRAPCGNDVVIIPEESPAVYVQLNTTLKSLVLPKTGELILGQNMGLGFTETPAADCYDVGGDLEFVAVHPEPWFKPDNWCSSQAERGTCGMLLGSLLDVEMVPCVYDDVTFPREHSYFIDLSQDTPTLSVKSLKIYGTSLSTISFKNFLNTSEGQRMFRVSGSGDRLDITRRSCEDTRGCACGNDKPEIAKIICAQVEKKCSRPRCSKTIMPVGACCKMCGAVFNITRGYGFNFNEFSNLLKTTFLSGPEENNVNMMSSLTSEGWVQVVLSDVTGEKSVPLARRIFEDFHQDIGGHKYAIDAVLLDTGEPEQGHSAQSSGSMTGSIAGIVLGLIVLIIIIAVVVIFILHRTGRKIMMPHLPNMPTLPRFPRRTPRATARVLPGVFSQPRTASHIDPGFANPLYDTSPYFDNNTVMKDMELTEASIEDQPTFDTSERGFYNPLFGTQGPSMFSDPAEAGSSVSGGTSGGKGMSATAIKIDNSSSTNGDSTI